LSLSPTFFSIYINKLQICLEEAVCVGPTLIGIVIVLFIYVDYIVLMERSSYDLGKQLRILKDLCSSMGMTMNTDKMKLMIIISKNIT
jgi:hypothetical protein